MCRSRKAFFRHGTGPGAGRLRTRTEPRLWHHAPGQARGPCGRSVAAGGTDDRGRPPGDVMRLLEARADGDRWIAEWRGIATSPVRMPRTTDRQTGPAGPACDAGASCTTGLAATPDAAGRSARRARVSSAATPRRCRAHPAPGLLAASLNGCEGRPGSAEAVRGGRTGHPWTAPTSGAWHGRPCPRCRRSPRVRSSRSP